MDKRGQTACFIGHSEIYGMKGELLLKLTEQVEDLIRMGYKYFGSGGGLGFGSMAAEAVLKLKERYTDIHLILVLPYEQQPKRERWLNSEIELLESQKQRASKVVMLSKEYSSGVYYRQNRHLIDSSSVCVTYMVRTLSETSYAMNYAKFKRLTVINIG